MSSHVYHTAAPTFCLTSGVYRYIISVPQYYGDRRKAKERERDNRDRREAKCKRLD